VLRRAARRFLVAFGAAILLWVGLGNPNRSTPSHRAEYIEVDGLRIRALRAGRGDTTLIFLHGFGESLLAWRLVLDRFQRRYRILAVDLPGFGLSSKPPGPYDYPTYERWLGDLLMQETRGPVVVVGHSMGGQLAAGMALAHPERIVAAVLISPAGAGISPLLSDTGGIASPAMTWVATAVSYVLPSHDSAWLSETREALAYQPAADSLTSQAARRVLEQFDFAALRDSLRDLKQPVLLIWGRQDPTIPFEIGERIAAALPCRKFVPLFALHRPHQTHPDTVAAEITSFLRRPECGT
jgi:pimeloyl-ACP methyl ester carboxylesterase